MISRNTVLAVLRIRSPAPASVAGDSGDCGHHIPDSFCRARVEVTWFRVANRRFARAKFSGPVAGRSRDGKTVQKELQRGILSDALARGETTSGASLVHYGSHVRLRDSNQDKSPADAGGYPADVIGDKISCFPDFPYWRGILPRSDSRKEELDQLN